MRTVLVLLVTFALGVSAPLHGQRRVGTGLPQDPLALTNANVVDVGTGEIQRGVTVVLRDGRIASVGAGTAPAGVRTLDLDGKYLVPGLIDAHVHIASFSSAWRALESGVTTARSAGVSHYADVGLRELVRAGTLAGPDIVAAGYHVRPAVSEEAFLDDPGIADLIAGVESADAIRRFARTVMAHGVDTLKVTSTERAGLPDTDPRKQVYTESQLSALVEEALSKNVPVMCHAHGDEGARAAVLAGVRSIEHGTYMTAGTLQLMKERGTFFVPTYAIVSDLLEPGGDYDVPGLHIRARHMLPRLAETVRRAREIGVSIVAATDTGYGPQSVIRLSHEIAAFVELGMTPLEALQTATTVAAELLQKEKEIGRVAEGFEADLVAVDGNPLENVRVLQDPLLVVSNGRVAVDRLTFGRTDGSAPSGGSVGR